MKTITMFQATDGARFDSESQCRKHDQLVVAVGEAMLPLGQEHRIPHDKFVQHDREACLQAKRNLLAIIRKRFEKSNYPVLKNPDDAIHPMSAIGRIIDECGGPLNNAWGRIMRINWENFREYEQCYFALNPAEVTVEL